MPFFTKKPVTIEAVQFTYPPTDELIKFCPITENFCKVGGVAKAVICTLEGSVTVIEGDWIIKGVKEPCKPDIFKLTYSPAWPDDEQPIQKFNLNYLNPNNTAVVVALALVAEFDNNAESTMDSIVDAVLGEHPEIDRYTLKMMWIAINADRST